MIASFYQAIHLEAKNGKVLRARPGVWHKYSEHLQAQRFWGWVPELEASGTKFAQT